MKLRNFGQTDLGECCVYTKSKGRLYGEPLTQVVPLRYSQFGDFGFKIHWLTNNEAELRQLHEAVRKVVEEPGRAESLLEIRAALRAGRKALDKDRLANVIKARVAQLFSASKALGRDEIQLVAANLKRAS